MRKVRGLLKASHFIPSLIVSSIAFAFGVHYWWEGPAYVIAFTVFTGQLVVGWSNDLYDFADDQKHQRLNKPLVSGAITEKYLRSWLFFMVPFSFFVNIFGPLGFKGGLLYWLGIGFGGNRLGGLYLFEGQLVDLRGWFGCCRSAATKECHLLSLLLRMMYGMQVWGSGDPQ